LPFLESATLKMVSFLKNWCYSLPRLTSNPKTNTICKEVFKICVFFCFFYKGVEIFFCGEMIRNVINAAFSVFARFYLLSAGGRRLGETLLGFPVSSSSPVCDILGFITTLLSPFPPHNLCCVAVFLFGKLPGLLLVFVFEPLTHPLQNRIPYAQRKMIGNIEDKDLIRFVFWL